MDKNLLILLPSLMVLASSLSFIFLRKHKKYVIVSTIVVGTGFFISLFSSVNLGSEASILYQLDWIKLGEGLHLDFGILVDRLSIFMCSLVLFISFLVHMFSTEYMKDDPGKNRFFALLGFFTFSMLGLLLSSNYLFLFVFWELVGFSSYLLIGFWWKKPSPIRASKKAFLINRIGDIGLLIALMLIWSNYGSFSITELVDLRSSNGFTVITSIGICLLIAAIGKSAQFPLFNWLPDAMEGPTPVSALIHAATMVAAGVYLLVRSEFLFSSDALTAISVIGCTTALLGGISALSQYDIKKILAYSTISQLGYMVMGVGLGASCASSFHLITHAFFKAGLFLGAGAVIHLLHEAQKSSDKHFDPQDIRNMGGMKSLDKTLFISFMICSAGLAGLPLFSGFLSKDAILSASLLSAERFGGIYSAISVIGFLTALLTPIYIGRLLWYVFFKEYSEKLLEIKDKIISNTPAIQLPLVVLAFCSLGIVFSLNPIDYHSSFFISWLGFNMNSSEEWHNLTSVLSVVLVLLGIFTSYLIYQKNLDAIKKRLKASSFYQISVNAFFLDSLTHKITVPGLLRLSSGVKYLDKRVIDRAVDYLAVSQVILAHVIALVDYWIVDGSIRLLSYLSGRIGKRFGNMQSGNIQKHIIWVLFFTLLVMLLLLS
ncbi:MAG: NADH-quinone oxidoreductase subunit L [Bacteroidota bacterium]